jgi:galactokinase
MQRFVGTISYQITQAAIDALQTGDAKKIGMLMKQPQEDFDKYLIPTCINELTSPVIHHLLNYPPVQEYIFGGKGVGSQGDGTAQFISKNEEY